MSAAVDTRVAVIVPNWNGADSLSACLDSLLAQTQKVHVIVVDNGSIDGSRELLKKYEATEVILHDKNKGFSGGVNAGFRSAIEAGFDYVAAFNNDAVAEKVWLENLVKELDARSEVGIATGKFLGADGSYIDSTGDYYTVWGLPYPRGRGEKDLEKYDEQVDVFAASGGASLYRVLPPNWRHQQQNQRLHHLSDNKKFASTSLEKCPLVHPHSGLAALSVGL
jgi:GT2 family glycosyltransferase